MTDAEKFIEQEIPLIHRAALPKALGTAYEAVSLTISETAWLQTPSARMTARGYLLPYAVDFALEKLIQSGAWPFVCEYDFYKRPTGKHLRILTPNAVLTVSQLKDEELHPRKAKFRENYSLENQTLFPFEAEEVRGALKAAGGRRHVILGHGYQELQFIQIGVPRPDGQGYLATTKNILEEIHDATPDVVPVEEVDAEEVVTLKEKLQRKVIEDAG